MSGNSAMPLEVCFGSVYLRRLAWATAKNSKFVRGFYLLVLLVVACIRPGYVLALDLSTAFELMLKHNAEYQAESHRLKTADYNVQEARSGLLPQINFVGSYSETRRQNTVIDQTFPSPRGMRSNEHLPSSPFQAEGDETHSELGLTRKSEVVDEELNSDESNVPSLVNGFRLSGVSVPQEDRFQESAATIELVQPLYDSEKFNRLRRDKSLRIESKLKFEEIRESLVLRLSQGYFNVLQAHDELNILLNELLSLEQHRKLTRRRYEESIGTLTDVHEANSRYAASAAALASAKLSFATARNALAALIGKPVDHLQPIAQQFSPELDTSLALDRTAYQGSRAYLQAKQRVQTAKYRLAQSKGQAKPRLNLRAERRYDQSSYSAFTSERDGLDNRISLELEVPLFASFGNYARVRKARYALRVSQSELLEQRRRADAQIKDGLAKYKLSFLVYEARLAAYRESSMSKDLRERGYLQGLSSNLDLLDSLRDSFSSQRRFRNALYDHLLNKIKFLATKQSIGIAEVSDLNRVLSQHAEDSVVLQRVFDESFYSNRIYSQASSCSGAAAYALTDNSDCSFDHRSKETSAIHQLDKHRQSSVDENFIASNYRLDAKQPSSANSQAKGKGKWKINYR